MSIYKLALTCFVPMLFCTPALGEIRLDDVELSGTYIDSGMEGLGMVRFMRVGLPVIHTTDGFVFDFNPLDAKIKIFEVEVGDLLSNETIHLATEIPDFVEGIPQEEYLSPGESAYVGYANQSLWMGTYDPMSWQVFGWMLIDRHPLNGTLRVLDSVSSYGPESDSNPGRFHASQGIIVGTTQVPEPSSALLGILAVAGLGLIRRRR